MAEEGEMAILEDNLYKKRSFPEGTEIEPCPICGAEPELWWYSENFEEGPIQKVVMCSNSEPFTYLESFADEGCLLFMPPAKFYCLTAKSAIKFWNAYAKGVVEKRTENLEKRKNSR